MTFTFSIKITKPNVTVIAKQQANKSIDFYLGDYKFSLIIDDYFDDK